MPDPAPDAMQRLDGGLGAIRRRTGLDRPGTGLPPFLHLDAGGGVQP
jgi:hypothetical protein